MGAPAVYLHTDVVNQSAFADFVLVTFNILEFNVRVSILGRSFAFIWRLFGSVLVLLKMKFDFPHPLF